MHIEVLVEDSSGAALLTSILPRILANREPALSWRIHSYRGIGKIPANLRPGGDPANRILLDQLPRLLRGYGATPGIGAVIVVLDCDQRPCARVLEELNSLLEACNPKPITLFRLAIEEMEAWYLGDRPALFAAYPKAKRPVLADYVQDSVRGTWELLADAVHPGGSASIKRAGWPLPGQLKHEWAERIGPLMDVEANVSPSFVKLREGVRRLVADP